VAACEATPPAERFHGGPSNFSEVVAVSADSSHQTQINRDQTSGAYQFKMAGFDLRSQEFSEQDGTGPVSLTRVVGTYEIGSSVYLIVEGTTPMCAVRYHMIGVARGRSTVLEIDYRYHEPIGRCGVPYKFKQLDDLIIAYEHKRNDPEIWALISSSIFLGLRFSKSELQKYPGDLAQKLHASGENFNREVHDERIRRDKIVAERVRQIREEHSDKPKDAEIQVDRETEIDKLLKKDAAGWLFNKYDADSVHNVNVSTEGGRVTSVRADYTFNRGQPGWVRVDYNKGAVPCLLYWDTPGECRPVNLTRQQWLAQQEAAANRARGSRPASSQRNTQPSHDDTPAPFSDLGGHLLMHEFGVGPLN
jgi:hypothetical protein